MPGKEGVPKEWKRVKMIPPPIIKDSKMEWKGKASQPRKGSKIAQLYRPKKLRELAKKNRILPTLWCAPRKWN